MSAKSVVVRFRRWVLSSQRRARERRMERGAEGRLVAAQARTGFWGRLTDEASVLSISRPVVGTALQQKKYLLGTARGQLPLDRHAHARHASNQRPQHPQDPSPAQQYSSTHPRNFLLEPERPVLCRRRGGPWITTLDRHLQWQHTRRGHWSNRRPGNPDYLDLDMLGRAWVTNSNSMILY